MDPNEIHEIIKLKTPLNIFTNLLILSYADGTLISYAHPKGGDTVFLSYQENLTSKSQLWKNLLDCCDSSDLHVLLKPLLFPFRSSILRHVSNWFNISSDDFHEYCKNVSVEHKNELLHAYDFFLM